MTRFGCVGFSTHANGFSVPQIWQFYLFTYPPRSKRTLSEDDFFAKIGIFCKSIAGPLSEVKKQLMVNWLIEPIELFMASYKSLSAKCSTVQNDGELMLMALSWVYALYLAFHALVYRWGCQLLSFLFHKITNIRSWRCFSSSTIRTQFSHTFCDITMIFKSRFVIFLSVVQAYTQPYSFSGKIKLIIC